MSEVYRLMYEKENVSVLHCDRCDFQFVSNYFDVVLCIDTIEHIQPPFFGKLGHILYLMGFRNNYFLTSFYNIDHVQIFTPSNLEYLFKNIRMTIVEKDFLLELSYPLDYYYSVVRSKHGSVVANMAKLCS